MLRVNNLMRTSVICSGLLLAGVLSGITLPPTAAYAASKPGRANAGHHGKVVAVDTTANTITIEHGKKTPHTFSVTPNTKITVDGASGKMLTDVATGMHVKIESAKKATAALSIEATTKKHKK